MGLYTNLMGSDNVQVINCSAKELDGKACAAF
jgi:hypothetical protein